MDHPSADHSTRLVDLVRSFRLDDLLTPRLHSADFTFYRCDYLLVRVRLFALLFRRPHLVVHYERLAAEPEAEMRRIMGYLGLDYEPTQVTGWADSEHHNLAGNAVRRAESSEIGLRESWREEMGWATRAGIDLIAAPGRALNWLKERRWARG